MRDVINNTPGRRTRRQLVLLVHARLLALLALRLAYALALAYSYLPLFALRQAKTRPHLRRALGAEAAQEATDTGWSTVDGETLGTAAARETAGRVAALCMRR